jgi:hypothetical protein
VEAAKMFFPPKMAAVKELRGRAAVTANFLHALSFSRPARAYKKVLKI